MAYCGKCYDQLPSEDAEYCINCGARQPREGPVTGPTVRLDDLPDIQDNGTLGSTILRPYINASFWQVTGLSAQRVHARLGVSNMYWVDGVTYEPGPNGELIERAVRIGIRSESFTRTQGEIDAKHESD